MDVKIKLNLTPLQLSKLKSAHKNNKNVSIRLSHAQLVSAGTHEIMVSNEQYKKVVSAMKSKAQRGVQLDFTPGQLGGWLPMLLSALAGPLISGITNAINGKNFFTGESAFSKQGKGMHQLGVQGGKGMFQLGSGLKAKSGRKKKV